MPPPHWTYCTIVCLGTLVDWLTWWKLRLWIRGTIVLVQKCCVLARTCVCVYAHASTCICMHIPSYKRREKAMQVAPFGVQWQEWELGRFSCISNSWCWNNDPMLKSEYRVKSCLLYTDGDYWFWRREPGKHVPPHPAEEGAKVGLRPCKLSAMLWTSLPFVRLLDAILASSLCYSFLRLTVQE